MAETVTVTRLAIKGSLKQTLQSTSPCESMIETVRRTSRNVKRWQSGDMCLRWIAAGMLKAERERAGNSIRPRSRHGLVFVDEASERVSPPNTVKSNDGL